MNYQFSSWRLILKGSSWVEMRSTKTTIPFVKNNEFDYSWLLVWLNKDLEKYTWIIFIPLVIIIVTAVSNGANITDGLDGLQQAQVLLLELHWPFLHIYLETLYLLII